MSNSFSIITLPSLFCIFFVQTHPILSKLGSTWLNLAQFGSTWLNLAQLSSTWLNSAQLGSTRPNLTLLDSIRLDSTRFNSAHFFTDQSVLYLSLLTRKLECIIINFSSWPPPSSSYLSRLASPDTACQCKSPVQKGTVQARNLLF